MKLHRFFIKFNIASLDLKITDEELINQIKNVLRLTKGDKVLIFNGEGDQVEGEIQNLNTHFIDLKLMNKNVIKLGKAPNVTLYCSVLKKENFEIVVQKATEIGINKIVPIITERTVKLKLRNDRLNKIIKEAAEQSGRINIPEFCEPINYEDAVNYSRKENKINTLFDASGKTLKIDKNDDVMSNDKQKNIGIFIGPEGGWSNAEIEISKESGFEIISLGETVLRAETAAIVASFIAVRL